MSKKIESAKRREQRTPAAAGNSRERAWKRDAGIEPRKPLRRERARTQFGDDPLTDVSQTKIPGSNVPPCQTINDVEEMRRKLATIPGARALMTINPGLVLCGDMPGRHPATLGSQEQGTFAISLQKTGGNVTPALIRPVRQVRLGRSKSAPEVIHYEVVSGERRAAASKSNRGDLLVEVVEIADRDMFVRRHIENSGHLPMVPLELGRSYAYALKQGWFGTNTELARAFQLDVGHVGKALKLAELPERVVDLFQPPKLLQYRFSKPLHDTMVLDLDKMLERADELERLGAPGDWKPKAICDFLVGTSADGENLAIEIRLADKTIVVFSKDAKGRLIDHIPGELTPQTRGILKELAKSMKRFK